MKFLASHPGVHKMAHNSVCVAFAFCLTLFSLTFVSKGPSNVVSLNWVITVYLFCIFVVVVVCV